MLLRFYTVHLAAIIVTCIAFEASFNDSCDPNIDKVSRIDGNDKVYVKCVPYTSSNETENNLQGKWVSQECKEGSIDDCINKAKNQTRMDSPQNDFGTEYVGLSSYPDKRIGQQYAMGYMAEQPISRSTCKASSPAVPGGTCCVDSYSKLEPDLKYPQYYLQCSPSSKNPSVGQWVRMQCPEDLVFDSVNQICVSSSTIALQSNQQSGRKASLTYANNPFSTLSHPYSSQVYAPCPDGSVAQAPCISGQCQPGMNCVSGVCCPAPKLLCEDGSPAMNNCRKDDDCAVGQYCKTDKGICCKKRNLFANPRSFTYALSSACPAALSSVITLCNSAYQCPSGSVCISSLGICCPLEQLPGTAGLCPHGSQPLKGSWCMTSNQCPSSYYCPISTRACCPLPVTTAPLAGNCPDGSSALSFPTKCASSAQCPKKCYCVPNLSICCVLPIVPFSNAASNTRGCPDGSMASSISCSSDTQCPNGYYCPGSVGFCCRIPIGGSSNMCPDGSESIGYCSNGMCGTEYACVKDLNICCPKSAIYPLAGECRDGSRANGYCLNGHCPFGFTCVSGVCCRGSSVIGSQCPDMTQPTSYCTNGRCAPGFVCSPGNVCCPQGQYPTRCPQGGQFVGFCMDGRCPIGSTCSLQNTCCTGGLNRVCPDGSQPFTSCINGRCPPGLVCINGVCCQYGHIETPKLCLNGLQPQGRCIKGQCGPGFQCTPENYCCPVSIIPGLCPDGKQPAGACINGLCGSGFTCLAGANICCTGSTQPTYCLDGSVPVGPCTAGLCGVGFICTTGNLCCPQAGAAPGRCPDGATSVGHCIGGLCAVGYYCTGDMCCAEEGTPPITEVCPDGNAPTESCTTDFQCSRPSSICIDGYNCCPLTSPEEGTGGVCPMGLMLYGPCVNGLCPDSMQCINGQCCGQPSMTKNFVTADTGVPNVRLSGLHSKPPGEKCANSDECSGAKSKMATCYKQFCTCLPPANPMRGTCVLRPVQRQHEGAPELSSVMQDSPMHNSPANRTVCTNSTQCRSEDHEHCISGICVSPKAPGDNCDSDNECMLNCAASSCQDRSGGKICVCDDGLYRYRRHCMKRCPQGTKTQNSTKNCEDTPLSLSSQDKLSFGSDIHMNSAC